MTSMALVYTEASFFHAVFSRDLFTGVVLSMVGYFSCTYLRCRMHGCDSIGHSFLCIT